MLFRTEATSHYESESYLLRFLFSYLSAFKESQNSLIEAEKRMATSVDQREPSFQ